MIRTAGRSALPRSGVPSSTVSRFSFTSIPAVHPGQEPPFVDESEVIARVLAGEREAFHVLLQRHSAALLASLRAALANREDAREVLQETWLRAYRNLAHLREPARLRAWLLSIALNLARARHRRADARVPEALGEPEPAVEDEHPADLERGEELARLRARMAELPARQREVVDLRVNHELSHAEIADLLGISEEASRASYYQGLRHLRQALERRETHA
jgi:RNA polymerase sigma-70 factor (ECF subfamily)